MNKGTKEFLGTISPAYGVLKGEGLFGELAPNLGLIPRAIDERREDNEKTAAIDAAAAQQAAAVQAGQVPAAKKGGKVKKYSIDGIAVRGKTRAKQK